MVSAVRYVPLLETLTTYKKDYLRFDIIAALTVAVVALPQSMAYAMIAGVDPAYGLYSAIVLTILGSMFGSSNHLNTGPTNAISLLIASNMAIFLGQGNFFKMLFLLTFMVGAIQFFMGVLKLGKLVNYVSHSVIVGFTAGAGIIIALGQLNNLLGISLPKGKMSTIEKVTMVFEKIDTLNYYALGLGLLTIAIILICKKISKNLPGALLGIIVSLVLVMTLGLDKQGLKLAGEIPSAIPPFSLVSFDFSAMGQLFGGAMVIAIIGLVEAVSIAKAISSQTLQKINPNQEFIGQGLANMGGAFFSSIAGSGSFTRSAITFQSGGITRLAGVLAGVIILIVLIFFAPYAKFIPNCSLAGVIMVVAYSMIDKKAVAKVFKSNINDAIVMTVTALTTVFAHELEYAIYAGVTISLLLYLKDTGTASVRRLAPAGNDGGFMEYEIENSPQSANPLVSIIQLEGNLYFGSSADLENKLTSAYNESKVFILRFKNVLAADITALEVIESFISRAQRDGNNVILSDVSPEIRKMMEKAHIIHHVGEENVFMTEQEIFASSTKALDKANAWLKGDIDLGFKEKLAYGKTADAVQ